MTDTLEVTIGANAASELKRRVERRIDLLDQIADLQEEIKMFKLSDKADGYDEKALGQVIKEIRAGADYREAVHTLAGVTDAYRRALGLDPVNTEDVA